MSELTARLAEIRARAEVATEGPWIVDPDESRGVMHPDKPDGFDGVMIAYLTDHDAGMFPREHNGAFIAHARQDVPQLVKALQAVLEVHSPRRSGSPRDEIHWAVCASCISYAGIHQPWPCPTVTAIETALGLSGKAAS